MPAGLFSQIGDYKLIDRIGHGGMGSVWLANKVGFQGISACVIKLLHANHSRDPKARELFLNEARLAAQLNHPNIVKVIDAGEADGQLYLVMDRVDGVDLTAYLKAMRKARLPLPLDVDITCFIIGEVLTALEYAHGRTIAGRDAGVVHFDITPNNILISSSGSVQLTDFGLSRVAAHNQNVSFIAGTPRYMSIEHHTATPRLASDIYGLGVILHELLTNTRYHDGLEPKQIRESILSGAIQPLDRDDLPVWLVQLRTQMLAGDYTQRPAARVALDIILRNVPGYRRASSEIAKTYKDIIGPAQSGMTVFLSTMPESHQSFDLELRDPTQNTRSLAPAPTVSTPPIQPDPPPTEPTEVLAGEAGTQTREGTKPVEVTSEELRPSGVMPVVQRDRTPWWIAGLVTLGVTSCVGMGFLIATVVQTKPIEQYSQPAEQLAVAEPPQPTPTVEVEPEPPPAAKPIEPVEPAKPVEPIQVAEPLPAEFVEPEPPKPAEPEPPKLVEPAKQQPASKPSEPAPAKTPVKVILYIKGHSTGTIAIGKKEYPVNTVGVAKLKPGSYSVKWRADSADAWHSVGKVKIADIAPNFYELRLGESSAEQSERQPGNGK